MPRPGVVLGLVGTNGIGKSTALKILSGKQKPNLGRVRYVVEELDSKILTNLVVVEMSSPVEVIPKPYELRKSRALALQWAILRFVKDNPSISMSI